MQRSNATLPVEKRLPNASNKSSNNCAQGVQAESTAMNNLESANKVRTKKG